MNSSDSISNPAESPARRAGRHSWLSYAAMIVVGLVLGATGIAVASDQTPSAPTSPSSAATADDDDGKPKADRVKEKGPHENRGAKNGKWRNAGKHLMRGGPAGAALHGEFVVPAGDGTFSTLAIQRGKVTAVSATSITLRSDDGFSRTYAINTETRVKARGVKASGGGASSIAKGSEAHVVAVKKGGSFVAQLVHDRAAPGQDKPKPKPSATSSGGPE